MSQTKNSKDVTHYFVNKIKNLSNNEIYVLGPSGNGKTFCLTRTVFDIRQKHQKKFRVLHIILTEDYVKRPSEHFWNDFYYCFVNDIESKNFPFPPNHDPNLILSQNWEECIKDGTIDMKHLNKIRKYFEERGIDLILVWDQDNLLQNIKLTYPQFQDFRLLETLRESSTFSLRIISTSNNNAGFMSIPPDSEIYTLNSGFTKVEFDKYVKEIAKMKDTMQFEINRNKLSWKRRDRLLN